MNTLAHKEKIGQEIKKFLEIMTKEHGYSTENAKILAISEVMDKAYELGREPTLFH
jgi:hypothetical protein